MINASRPGHRTSIGLPGDQRHLMAASHRCAVARCAGKVREMELNLPTLPALERLRCVGECGHRSRRDDGRERALRDRQHYGSIAFDLTSGEAADCKSYDTLIDLPERAPGALVADKAYDSDAIRDDLTQRGIRAVIPPRSNRTNTICYNKRLYRQRNCIERALGHLKISRAIATRYDQLADIFLGMLYLATARYWIKFVHAA